MKPESSHRAPKSGFTSTALAIPKASVKQYLADKLANMSLHTANPVVRQKEKLGEKDIVLVNDVSLKITDLVYSLASG